ncbi:MAG: hypothetical protein KAR45_16270, partial [Desulfobacteraceae bacterium]|nr:hypothetical protein [Desulfobacteraceae bacterium]
MDKIKSVKIFVILFIILSTVLISVCFAKDTDIYDISTKQNCYILMDNSGSMDFGVYEHTIDYFDMFKYLFDLDAAGGNTAHGNTYIYDTVNNSDYFYTHSQTRRQIYLWKGKIGVTIATVNGEDMAFTGDAADPDYLWYSADIVDTYTVIDNDGNLANDGSGNDSRLTVDGDGYILLDGSRLPIGQNIKLHQLKELYDGSVINNGFGGLLNAPGYYFSGYEGVVKDSLDIAETGDPTIYFFLTGNWANMQAMYNLHYVTNNPTPPGAQLGDFGWKYEVFPLAEADWSLLAHALAYPGGSGNYENGLSENETELIIEHPGAKKIQVHFSVFDVNGDGDNNTWANDYVVLKDSKGHNPIKYDNDNNPTGTDGWSATVDGDTVKICLASNADTNGTGYTIDKIRIVYAETATGIGGYLMQNRLDVAKDAMLYALDAFTGKMNWGFAAFKDGDGATLHHALNPNVTDDANNASITTHVNNLAPNGGTPLGEALQDV